MIRRGLALLNVVVTNNYKRNVVIYIAIGLALGCHVTNRNEFLIMMVKSIQKGLLVVTHSIIAKLGTDSNGNPFPAYKNAVILICLNLLILN